MSQKPVYNRMTDENIRDMIMKKTHNLTWFTFFMSLAVLAIVIALIVLVPIMKHKLYHIGHSIQLTLNDECDDNNDCTADFMFGNEYEICQHYNVKNGQECNNVCFNSSMDQLCSNGVCDGTCLGVCSEVGFETQQVDCPTLYVKDVTFTLNKATYCFRTVCNWVISGVDELILQYNTTTCPDLAESYSNMCLGLLDPLSSQNECITANYCSVQSEFGNGICTFNYNCATTYIPSNNIPDPFNFVDIDFVTGYPPGFNTTVLF